MRRVSSSTIGWYATLRSPCSIASLQIRAELDLQQAVAGHRGVVDLPHALAAVLGGVHRGVSLAQHRGRLRPGMPEREPDAGMGRDAVAGDLEGRYEGGDDAIGHAGRFLQRRVLQEDRELVTTQPRRRVPGSDQLAEPARDLDEEPVTGRVTETVVDELEVVDIEEDDADVTGVTPQ